ncbi:MAG: repair protein SbcD/Mre11 [Chloroflexota bacterium]|jgi:DNA repair exonuclease SbcCD nuclease subunit|nr:repair protein SbcD/Mre11 [Chloroflexota bacterium]
MPRLLHMADVHLGARHKDLGPAAAKQRDRQFAAFRRAVDTALERSVDVVLIAGDLFDSNAQPRRSAEKAASELRRLADRGIPTVLIPGTHDCYDATSIYRALDLGELAGLPQGSPLITLLTPERPDVVFPGLDLVVYGRAFDTKRAPRSPLAGFDASTETRARHRVGLIHGALAIPGMVESDDVIFTTDEIAKSGLQYLALGHWHSFQQGRVGSTTWAYAGAPEPVAVDQDGAGQVLIVELPSPESGALPALEAVLVGKTRFRRVDVDAGAIVSQPDLVRELRAYADPDTVLEVRLAGIAPDALDLHADDVERELSDAFLAVRVRDSSVAGLPDGPLPPAETIAGAFIRDLRARIEAAETAGDDAAAAEAREILHLGRLLLDDPRRVTLV